MMADNSSTDNMVYTCLDLNVSPRQESDRKELLENIDTLKIC